MGVDEMGVVVGLLGGGGRWLGLMVTAATEAIALRIRVRLRSLVELRMPMPLVPIRVVMSLLVTVSVRGLRELRVGASVVKLGILGVRPLFDRTPMLDERRSRVMLSRNVKAQHR